jgi:hypothetical protein
MRLKTRKLLELSSISSNGLIRESNNSGSGLDPLRSRVPQNAYLSWPPLPVLAWPLLGSSALLVKTAREPQHPAFPQRRRTGCCGLRPKFTGIAEEPLLSVQRTFSGDEFTRDVASLGRDLQRTRSTQAVATWWVERRPAFLLGPDAALPAAGTPFGTLRSITWGSLVNRTMTYDAAGNVKPVVDGVNTETTNYAYDELDQLTTVSGAVAESYFYDLIGNIVSTNGLAYHYYQPGGTTTSACSDVNWAGRSKLLVRCERPDDQS